MSIVTWSPINKGTGVALSNDNLTATISQRHSVIATEGRTTGKWYWEITCDSSSANLYSIGIANSNASINISWEAGNSGVYYGGTGYTYGLSSLLAGGTLYGASFSAGDIIGVLLDIDNKTINFSKNGALQGELEYIVTGDEIYPMISRAASSGSAVVTANFGDTPFKYPVPSGYRPYQYANKTLILSENEYKRLALTEGIEKSVNMEEGSTVNISSNVWTVGNLIKLNRNLKLNMVGYYTGTSSSIGIRIYDNLTSDVIFSGDRVSTIQGWNYFDISDVLLEKDKEYVVGFYGNIIHGRTIPLPTIYHSINNDFSMTVIERRQATSDIFPSTVATVYLPIIDLIGVLEEDEIKEWETISQSLPTLSQFQEEGMEDLSILDRKVQQVLGSPQQMTDNGVLGEGKVFKGAVDLKKYFDLRKLEVK